MTIIAFVTKKIHYYCLFGCQRFNTFSNTRLEGITGGGKQEQLEYSDDLVKDLKTEEEVQVKVEPDSYYMDENLPDTYSDGDYLDTKVIVDGVESIRKVCMG
jgi:hypothetical protein